MYVTVRLSINKTDHLATWEITAAYYKYFKGKAAKRMTLGSFFGGRDILWLENVFLIFH